MTDVLTDNESYEEGVRDALEVVEDFLGFQTIGTVEASVAHSIFRRIKQELL